MEVMLDGEGDARGDAGSGGVRIEVMVGMAWWIEGGMMDRMGDARDDPGNVRARNARCQNQSASRLPSPGFFAAQAVKLQGSLLTLPRPDLSPR